MWKGELRRGKVTRRPGFGEDNSGNVDGGGEKPRHQVAFSETETEAERIDRRQWGADGGSMDWKSTTSSNLFLKLAHTFFDYKFTMSTTTFTRTEI